MAPRKHAASVFCALTVIWAAFLCFENFPRSGKQPSPISRVTVPATRGSVTSPTRPTPRAHFQHHGWTDDEFADLRRDQSRSSVLEIQKTFAGAASTVNFNWINPGPVNPYVQIFGQYTGMSGKLQAFAWEPSHPNVMYAGGGIGSGNEGPATEAGVFKSTDGGTSWAPANQGLLDTAVNVLWVDT